MIHYQFAIHDNKAGAYLPPFILPRIEMAQRTFADCINSADHQFGAHPDDYTLFSLGLFDDETAKFTPEMQSLGNGVEYLQLQGDNDATLKIPTPPISNDPPVLGSATGNNSS